MDRLQVYVFQPYPSGWGFFMSELPPQIELSPEDLQITDTFRNELPIEPVRETEKNISPVFAEHIKSQEHQEEISDHLQVGLEELQRSYSDSKLTPGDSVVCRMLETHDGKFFFHYNGKWNEGQTIGSNESFARDLETGHVVHYGQDNNGGTIDVLFARVPTAEGIEYVYGSQEFNAEKEAVLALEDLINPVEITGENIGENIATLDSIEALSISDAKAETVEAATQEYITDEHEFIITVDQETRVLPDLIDVPADTTLPPKQELLVSSSLIEKELVTSPTDHEIVLKPAMARLAVELINSIPEQKIIVAEFEAVTNLLPLEKTESPKIFSENTPMAKPEELNLQSADVVEVVQPIETSSFSEQDHLLVTKQDTRTFPVTERVFSEPELLQLQKPTEVINRIEIDEDKGFIETAETVVNTSSVKAELAAPSVEPVGEKQSFDFSEKTLTPAPLFNEPVIRTGVLESSLDLPKSVGDVPASEYIRQLHIYSIEAANRAEAVNREESLKLTIEEAVQLPLVERGVIITAEPAHEASIPLGQEKHELPLAEFLSHDMPVIEQITRLVQSPEPRATAVLVGEVVPDGTVLDATVLTKEAGIITWEFHAAPAAVLSESAAREAFAAYEWQTPAPEQIHERPNIVEIVVGAPISETAPAYSSRVSNTTTVEQTQLAKEPVRPQPIIAFESEATRAWPSLFSPNTSIDSEDEDTVSTPPIVQTGRALT